MKLYCFSILLAAAFSTQAQATRTVTVRKLHHFIFYQEGKANDTLLIGKTDRFRLVVPDSLKEQMVIEIDNGVFREQADGIVSLEPLRGLRYRHVYQKDLIGVFSFQAMIDGVAQDAKDRVTIRFRKRGAYVLENIFFSPLVQLS
jgi:hypothetical protein